MIPAELRRLNQWVGWIYVERDGKRTKMPINIATGEPASSTNPETWVSYDEAVARMDEWNQVHPDNPLGIGFVFTRASRIVGIDLDHVLTPDGLDPKAQQVVTELDSYTERSPSGTGLHVYLRADWPHQGRKKSWLEVYSTGRYFTVTGDHWQGTPETLPERTEALKAVVARELPRPTSAPPAAIPPMPNQTDERILRKAMLQNWFATAWSGDLSKFEGDESKADFAVVSRLAEYTRDPVQIDRLFRTSRLMRHKWDERRGEETYGALTIRKALESLNDDHASA